MFTPESANGEVELTFKASTSNLAGHSLVAFEELRLVGEGGKEIPVANHKDLKE